MIDKKRLTQLTLFSSISFFTLLITGMLAHLLNKKRVIKSISNPIAYLIIINDHQLLEQIAVFLIKQNFIHKVIFQTTQQQIIKTKEIYQSNVKIFHKKLILRNKERGYFEIAYS